MWAVCRLHYQRHSIEDENEANCSSSAPKAATHREHEMFSKLFFRAFDKHTMAMTTPFLTAARLSFVFTLNP